MYVRIHCSQAEYVTIRLRVHLSCGMVCFNVTDNILSVTSNYIFLMLLMVNVESSTYEGRSMPLLPHTLHADEGS